MGQLKFIAQEAVLDTESELGARLNLGVANQYPLSTVLCSSPFSPKCLLNLIIGVKAPGVKWE